MKQREIAKVLISMAAAQARGLERLEQGPGCGMPQKDYEEMLARSRLQLEALTWAAEKAAQEVAP